MIETVSTNCHLLKPFILLLYEYLRSLSPLLAALCLAVLVGIGENIDVKAHFFGFGFGVLFSPIAMRMEKRWSSPPLQIIGVIRVYAIYGAALLIAQH